MLQNVVVGFGLCGQGLTGGMVYQIEKMRTGMGRGGMNKMKILGGAELFRDNGCNIF